LEICDDLEKLKSQNKDQAEMIAALQNNEKYLNEEIKRKNAKILLLDAHQIK
jgi:hypothetical protein